MYIQSLGPLKEKDKKLAGKPLLLLLYMLIEYEENKKLFSTHELARLIWQSSYGRKQDKPDEKTLSSLNNAKSRISSAVSQERGTKYALFTMSDFAEKPATGLRENHGILCDALDFLSAIKQDNFSEAFELYKAPFLEKYPTRDISETFKNWVDTKRIYFAQIALDTAINWAFHNPTSTNAHLQIAKLLTLHSLSDFSRIDLIRSFAWLEKGQHKTVLDEVCQRKEIDFLSVDYPHTDVLDVMLYLSLTDSLPLICSVLSIDSHDIPVIRDALEDFDYEQNPSFSKFANFYFKTAPKEKSTLLERLCQQAVPSENLLIYLEYFKQVETLKNIPWSKTQQIIIPLLENLVTEGNFELGLNLISDYNRLSTGQANKDVASQVLFYQAYILERKGLFEEALKLIQPLKSTAQLLALKSSLIEKTKNYHEAEVLALDALEKANGGKVGRWTMAMAQTTLARLAFHNANYIKAISLNKKAIEWWKASEESLRAIGMIINTATYFDFAGSAKQIKKKDVIIEVKKLYKEAYSLIEYLPTSVQTTQKVRLSLNRIGFQTDYKLANNTEIEKAYLELIPTLNAVSHEVAAKVWYNLGYFYKQIGNYEQAIVPLKHTTEIIKHADQMLVGCAKGELALISHDIDLLETAIEILLECGHTPYCCFYIENLLELVSEKRKEAISEKSKSFYKDKETRWLQIKTKIC